GLDVLLAGPRGRRVLVAVDAERPEHRLALEHEQRGVPAQDTVRLRHRDDLRALVAAAAQLHLVDLPGRPQARHEAVARRLAGGEVDRVALLERTPGDLTAQDDVALHALAIHARDHHDLLAGADRRQLARRRGDEPARQRQ